MKVRFIGTSDPSDHSVCVAFGQSFPKDKWTNVDAETGAKLDGNPTFETKGAPTDDPVEVVSEESPPQE